MNLRARRKAQDAQEQSQQTQAEVRAGELSESIYLRCNAMLYHTLHNMVSSAHAGADYTYTSISDVIRAALNAHKEGMPLTEMPEPRGRKTALTLRVTPELKEHYQSLPDRLRTQIVERAIRTYLKRS